MDQGTGDTETQDNEEERGTSDEQIPSTSADVTQGRQKIIFWTFLEHKGPFFEPPYKRLPGHIKLKYNKEVVELSEKAEELAGLYAKKLHRPCVTQPEFNKNFFAEWRAVMTPKEQQLIKDLYKCDFKKIQAHYTGSKKSNKKIKQKQEKEIKNTYGRCIIINMGNERIEPIKNYKMEPQDLFCSNGSLMGRLKKRVTPEDVTINCSANSEIPEPPPGHNWKEVVHDNTVSWLGSWKCNITDTCKYITLDSRSKSKQETDRKKYEIARKLHKYITKIRTQYRRDWQAENLLDRQRGVALYLIDNFGFRAGNEKEPGGADTVGCCSLKVKHIRLSKYNKVVFDFEGKASVRYNNEVTVEESVYRNLSKFLENKENENDLFDKLSTKKRKNTSSTRDSTDNTIYNTRSSLCNYIDPRIVVTWCERHNIPIDEVYTDALRDQFSWAIQEAGPNFLFCW
ncbi:DNA topoisomerase I, mitochondrial isoform X2 [Manduca sexta]|uniref:DNA topoisomerase I, mitochondrial isoform X2 n=1 Tax=Manduca sexta TaxID=7130 RepID=UPI0011839A73|nr:DNA topoisomerase I, mitochondrial isoform X2 [Manduca sexta]